MKLATRLALLRERIGQRVEGRAPDLPDLKLPSPERLRELHDEAARAAGQVGVLNPRPPGIHHQAAQALKRAVERALRWQLRPQREFNAGVLAALRETRELLAEYNRALLVLAQAATQAQSAAAEAREQVACLERIFSGQPGALGAPGEQVASGPESRDSAVRTSAQAIEELKSKVASIDYHLVNNVKHLDAAVNAVQEGIWAYRKQHDAQHAAEMSWIRARLAESRRADRGPEIPEPQSHAQSQIEAPFNPQSAIRDPQLPGFDYVHFEALFRGSEEKVRAQHGEYLPLFEGRSPVLDVACGRGEFLRLLRERGIEARGVDADATMVAACIDKGLEVVRADAFAYLNSVADGSLGGVFCSQFVEHLQAPQLVRLIGLAYQKLRSGGLVLFETQNPECLAIYSQSFFLDPTHARPIPAQLMRFLLEEAGFRDVSVRYVSPVAPELPQLPTFGHSEDVAVARWNREAERFNQTYFGFRDYAITGVK